ncbi:signal peptidase I [Agromyces allii]|uniref:Signal peptidase I n=1 Tax=Agromyces allii TaxID=393607 RepID=A0ABN2QPD2_9MICO|nr:signal peptidase I [Agromyces allii]
MNGRRIVVALAGMAIVLGLVAVAAAALGETVYRADSPSMRPAIEVGDVVVAARLSEEPRRGDMVVFSDPGDWGPRVARLLGQDRVADTFVKRVVGLPGERIACCTAAGELTVDGVPLVEAYRVPAEGLASVLAFDEVVPDDAVFVLGDARSASIDSRYLGSVPMDAVTGVVQLVVPLGG